MFFKEIDGEVFSYPVPTSKGDVLPCYVRGARKKFKLTKADGVSDEQFYNP